MKEKSKVKSVKVGILSLEQFKARSIAIAKGEYIPSVNEPRIWFPSIKSLASILSEENQALLKAIELYHPNSMTELSEITKRKPNNISRTLKTMEKYGLVRLHKKKGQRGRAPLVPEVIYKLINIDIALI